MEERVLVAAPVAREVRARAFGVLHAPAHGGERRLGPDELRELGARRRRRVAERRVALPPDVGEARVLLVHALLDGVRGRLVEVLDERLVVRGAVLTLEFVGVAIFVGACALAVLAARAYKDRPDAARRATMVKSG